MSSGGQVIFFLLFETVNVVLQGNATFTIEIIILETLIRIIC